MSVDHDDDRQPGRFPPDFASWPLDAQITYIEMSMTRKGLIASALSHAGLNPDEYDLRDDSKLSKKELAAIYLTLEGLNE